MFKKICSKFPVGLLTVAAFAFTAAPAFALDLTDGTLSGATPSITSVDATSLTALAAITIPVLLGILVYRKVVKVANRS